VPSDRRSLRWWLAPAVALLGALVATVAFLPSRLTGIHVVAAPVPSASAGPSPSASRARPAAAASPATTPATRPRSGPGTFRYGTTAGPVLGRGGRIHRFRVGVESNLATIDINRLAAEIDAVLGDRRSWIAGGQVRFQRVPAGAPFDFTIQLATSRTTRAMCTAGGVAGTMGYTSCRYGGHVVLNLDRWLSSVPYYSTAGLPLPTYRTYMINHEVGHELGHGHELCPGRGRPAPVMEQQTLGLHGCAPNPWPYLNGSRYTGPPGSY
jgi:hypothetical protein